MTGETPRSDDRRSVEDIQRDIERTQREMSRTIDTIQYRLSPDYIKSKAKVRMREISRDTQTRVKSKMKDNPAALAVIGAGLWMLFRDRDSGNDSRYMFGSDYDNDHYHVLVCDVCGSAADSAGYVEHDEASHGFASSMRGSVSDRASHLRESAGERAEQISNRASEAMHNVGERASEMKDRISSKASEAGDRIGERAHTLATRSRYQMMRARRRASGSLQDNPFILGGIGVVVGALIGAVIPESDRERELMGPARERAMERARELAREKGSQARDMARAVGEAALREGKDEAKRQMDENDLTDRSSSSSSSQGLGSSLGSSEFRP